MTSTFQPTWTPSLLRRRLIAPLVRWYRCAQTERRLRALDDRTLDDIGISRHQIPNAVARAYAARLAQETAPAAPVHILPLQAKDRGPARTDILRSKAA
ncbi:MAG: DUF1127 domain-containing protein [Rhodospirillales bacterium]|jgi:uncharacterized protein YjiS (DUF1127 family)|nr:DUF1127 domain-containing protein [Rhodospirillales bacterium]MDP6884412.1 DUF1127 domain-containing protein [Rhodospirillales bacterium]